MKTAAVAQPIKRGRRVCTRRDATMAVHLMLHKSRQSKENLPDIPCYPTIRTPAIPSMVLPRPAVRADSIPSRRITSGSLRPGGKITKRSCLTDRPHPSVKQRKNSTVMSSCRMARSRAALAANEGPKTGGILLDQVVPHTRRLRFRPKQGGQHPKAVQPRPPMQITFARPPRLRPIDRRNAAKAV